ncbi:MAG: Maff2 family protein [Ethanoligenens sp.]
MELFTSAVSTSKTLVVALGAVLGLWGSVNLTEGYGGENAASMRKLHKEAAVPHKEAR